MAMSRFKYFNYLNKFIVSVIRFNNCTYPPLKWRLNAQSYSRLQGNVHGKQLISQTYDEVELVRTNQARRSLLIQEAKPSNHLLEYILHHGPVAHAISYKQNDTQYTLIEYRDLVSLQRFIAGTRQFANSQRIPFPSRFIYFSPASSHGRSGGQGSRTEMSKIVVQNLELNSLTDADLAECDSLTSQITRLNVKLSLSDLDIRLRYLLCSVFEDMIRRLFPGAENRLFGSSVSGLGRHDCDLDMVMDLDKSPPNNRETNHRGGGATFFLSKMRPDSDEQAHLRVYNQRSLAVVAGILEQFMPHALNVRRILRARVPIIKFIHSGTQINCDLCLDNKSAMDMSRLLQYVCQLDLCVAPLVFVVRQWARSSGVTQSNPGPWISNFMLSLLVVFHLQMRPSGAVLPSLLSFKRSTAHGPLIRLTDDISLPSRSPTKSNADNLDVLLIEFFKFYGDFNFGNSGVSLVNGAIVTKPDEASPIYIENPLERELNVSKNVLREQVEKFQTLCRTAGTSLENTRSNSAGEAWGLLSILKCHDQELEKKNDNDVIAFDVDNETNMNDADTREAALNIEEIASVDNLNAICNPDVEYDGDRLLASISNTAAKTKFNVSMREILSDDIGTTEQMVIPSAKTNASTVVMNKKS